MSEKQEKSERKWAQNRKSFALYTVDYLIVHASPEWTLDLSNGSGIEQFAQKLVGLMKGVVQLYDPNTQEWSKHHEIS